MSFHQFVSAIAIALTILTLPVYAQINTPCNASMITSLAPCMNFITNSSANGTSPNSDCCNSLKSLTSSGMDCLCLVITGNVPFQINRTLALSLPRACNMPGVPLQCKASASPVPAPAPGPASLGPTLSPRSPLSPSPTASSIPTLTPPTLAPEPDSTQSPSQTSPTVLTPSAATLSYSLSPSMLLFITGVLVVKFY